MKYTDDIEEFHYAVDIPQCFNGDPIDEWYCVEYFKTEAEAIKYAREYFGADEEGKVSLVSHF
jgi:hypothetical protein